jgi:hypothetical protein
MYLKEIRMEEKRGNTGNARDKPVRVSGKLWS